MNTRQDESAPMGLEIHDVRKRFGGLVALDGCSFACAAGTITGLVGPNGSGKSTLFNAVTGIAKPDAGEVTLGGRRLTHLRPHQIARAGVGRTFQTTRLFNSLSVLENVLLGLHADADRDAAGRAAAVLEQLGIAPLAERCAGELSFGQRRLAELARALIGRPAFILLDEPFAGLSPAVAAELERHVAALPIAGVGVVLIEHDLAMITRLCPRIVVLHRGKVIADGTPDDIRHDRAVVASYLGEA
ncbi:MAG: ABC transporter ATP-binding protein [Lautropia sp.]